MATTVRPSTEAALAEALCPGCASPTVDFRLESAQDDGALHAASCLGCNMTFQVRTGEPPAGVAERVGELACPACAAREAEFVLVCELPGLICGLRVICGACGTRYGKDVV